MHRAQNSRACILARPIIMRLRRTKRRRDRHRKDARGKGAILLRKRRNDLALARAVGERMRNFRYARGLSLVQLYERGGPTPSHMSSIERGKVDFTIDTIRGVAEALEILPWQLLTNHDELAFDAVKANPNLFVSPYLEMNEPSHCETAGK